MTINNSVALRYAAACVNGSEGFRATAYLDTIAKPPIWTIGHGTTRIAGRPVRRGDTCTRAQADAWSAADMQATLNSVLRLLEVDINDWQMASLVSLSYNIGMGNFRNSTVIAALNEGCYRQAADCILEYDHAGGVRIPGLTARRIREREMFLVMMPPDLDPAPRSVSPIVTVAAKPEPLSEADQLNQQFLDRDTTA